MTLDLQSAESGSSMSGEQFWDKFLTILEGGERTSSVQYYLPNQGSGATAQPGEWAHVIDVTFQRTAAGSPERVELVTLLADVGFWAPTDDLNFWIGADLNDTDLNDLRAAAEARFPNMFTSEGQTTFPGITNPEGTTPGDGSAGPGSYIGGGTIVKIARPGQEPLWGMRFGVDGGISHIYTFGSPEEMEAALGEGAAVNQGFETVQEGDLNQGDQWIMGDAAMFAGQEGDYAGFWGDLVDSVALKSGIRDPGRLGRYIADPEVAQKMAEGFQAGWTPLQLQAELRRTTYYQETLYPGIKNILDRGETLDPEGEWREYANNVEDSLRMLGYETDEFGTYAQQVGKMLDLKIEDEDFLAIAPMYKRATENSELFEALDFWLDETAGRNVNFDDLFDAIAGIDSGDLTDAIEKAVIQFHAQAHKTSLDPAQITRLAGLSQLSESEISAAFTSTEEALLALGPKYLGIAGLTEQDLIAASFDIKAESGLSTVEIQRRAGKAIRERGLSDDPKAQFFGSFTEEGKPFRPGLLASAPEAG
jgi:hypothetical protein